MTRKTLRSIAHMSKLKGAHGVKVGLPKGSNDYPDGTSVINVGLWNEFGTKHIPERSFMRSSVKVHASDYKTFNKRALRKIQAAKSTPKKELGRLGLLAVGDMQAMIVAVSEPPNAKSTTKSRDKGGKGSSNPLVDTGHLGRSITHQVIGKRAS